MSFFTDLGAVLQKLCGGSSFSSGHKLEFLNGGLATQAAEVQEMLDNLAGPNVCDNHASPRDDIAIDENYDDDEDYAYVTVHDLFVFTAAFASDLSTSLFCTDIGAALLEFASHRLLYSQKTSEKGLGGEGVKVALNPRSLSKMIAGNNTSGSKRISDMTNDDLVQRLRALETANNCSTQETGQSEINIAAAAADPTADVAISAAAAATNASSKLPRGALLSQCLQFFWMGFAWPSMGAVLPRIREMFDLNYAQGTLVFGVFACGLMLGCCFAFDEGRALILKAFVLLSGKFRNAKKVLNHVQFQDEDQSDSELRTANLQQKQQNQYRQRHSFLQRLIQDGDKMKLLASVTLTVIAQLLMGTIVQHAPYAFCLLVWFLLGLANTGLNIFSGIVVSRLAPAQTTAIFACQGPSYGIAAMLASPLAAAIMTRMDNDFSWFYLLQAAVGFCVIGAIGASDFPHAVGNSCNNGTITDSSKSISSNTSHFSLLVRDRRFAFVTLSSFFYWGLDGVLSQWITTVLLDQGHTLSFSSQVLSLLWAGVLVGRVIMALASISIFKGTPLRNSVLMLMCIPPALVLAAAIALTSPAAGVLLAIVFLYGIFLAPIDALLRGMTGALFKHPDTGQTNTPFTILFFACNGSLLVFTPLAGIFIQTTGSGRAGLCVGVVCGVCVLCTASLLWKTLTLRSPTST
jgi:fucose permease